MWNTPSKEQLDKISRLYSTDFVASGSKRIFMHLFLGDCDWYIAEYDGEDLFYGFVILNGDYQMAEWGYISFQELKSLKIGYAEIEHDLYWKQRPDREVEKTVRC